MSRTYKAHECRTLEEINALALTDNQENGAYVISPTGELCNWTLPYAIRNEGEGSWSYQDGYGGDSLRFPLTGDETVTVLALVEPEESALKGLVRAVLAEMKEQEERKRLATEWKSRALFLEVQRRMDLMHRPAPLSGFGELTL